MLATVETSHTSRGFGFGKFFDSKGVECSIQDSSASGASIWFGVRDANPQKLVDGISEKVPLPINVDPRFVLFNDRMHLRIPQTRTLIRNFEKYLETGKVRSRKFIDRYGSTCSIKKTDGLIELGPDDPNPQVCDNGWRPLPYPEDTIWTTHMFLGEEQIVLLLPMMKRFVEGGYVVE